MLDLVKALEDGLRAEPDDWEDEKLHISDLGATIPGEGCLRQVWLRINGVECREHTPGKLWMFKQGNRIHELVPELLSELPLGWYKRLVEEKTNLKGLTGRYDLSLMYGNCEPLNITGVKEMVIADFKTVRGAAFGYLDEPKGSHVAQLQGYLMAEDADYGIILYIDREGSNGFRQFIVERNDKETTKRCERLNELPGMSAPPSIESPKTRLRKNKNDHAIYVEMPWTCRYCDFCDISCPGAVPEECRSDKVVGKVIEDDASLTFFSFGWKMEYPDDLRKELESVVINQLTEEQDNG